MNTVSTLRLIRCSMETNAIRRTSRGLISKVISPILSRRQHAACSLAFTGISGFYPFTAFHAGFADLSRAQLSLSRTHVS